MLLSEINAAVQLIKEAVGAVRAMHDPDPAVQRALDDLLAKTYELHGKVAELWSENETLKRQISHGELTFDADSGAMYRPDDTDKKEPFCQRCLQSDGKLCNLHMQELQSVCRVCGAVYRTAEQSATLRAEEARVAAEKRARRQQYADGTRRSPW